jgi:hypothetical protein
MVKKSIIAIALIGMLATVSFAQSTQAPGQFKVDGMWPCQYVPVEICRIPIVMDIGMFIEIENCAKKKIVLKQVTCPAGKTFPCYSGCTEIRVRANFQAQLGLKLYPIANFVISSFFGNYNWTAYFKDASGTYSSYIIDGDGNWHAVEVCVDTWDANIYAAKPGNDACKSAVSVGEVAVTAVPTAACACPQYCPPQS